MKTSLKEMILYGVWLCMYILCVGLGTVEEVEGIGKFLFIAVSVIFFLPGAWILYMGIQEKNKKMLLRVRILAICSLTLTVIFFCANVIAVASSAEVGKTLNDMLNLVSAPMFCSQYWILSIFLWSCLLSASFTKIKEQ
jgi:hypothetical protein